MAPTLVGAIYFCSKICSNISPMPTRYFYKNLATAEGFAGVSDPIHYQSVPSDWYIVITDVRGSTKAIEAGQYKEVNMVGASSIAAMLHLSDETDIPFVFGGDGATFVIPPYLLSEAKMALSDSRARAKNTFGMELRVGFVPVQTVIDAGYRVDVAKFKISKHYEQAMFRGGGLSYAEKLVKDPATEELYSLSQEIVGEADLHGLSCRWRDVESKHGETVSIIVKARGMDEVHESMLYRDAIARIDEIFGDVDMHHPIAAENLRISLSNRVYEKEVMLEASHQRPVARFFSVAKLRVLMVFSSFVDYFNIPTPWIDFKRYKHVMVRSTDYKKFDDLLRMVISGTTEQRMELERYLEALYRDGKIFYGVHVSNRALMTCLVFDREGKQVHFVDGADGGYTLAAKQLKGQIAAKNA